MGEQLVTVVIPALNAESTIGQQISALAAQAGAPPFSVVVVDNGSDDNTAEVAQLAAAGRLRLAVVHEPRRGVNRARNAGVAAAPEGVVLLCDADDEVAPDFVAVMSAAVDHQHWEAGAVDYVPLNDEATRRVWGAPEVGVPEVADPYIDRTFGCCCGFLRSMWASVGGFDPGLSGPTDENEFFMRAHMVGFRPRVVSEAIVAYRLRPGIKAWRRMRYRSGLGQGVAAGATGGRYLLPVCRPPRSLLMLLKLIVVAPKYVWSPAGRQEWVGGLVRQWGRVVGWFSRSGRTVRASERSSSSADDARPGQAH